MLVMTFDIAIKSLALMLRNYHFTRTTLSFFSQTHVLLYQLLLSSSPSSGEFQDIS